MATKKTAEEKKVETEEYERTQTAHKNAIEIHKVTVGQLMTHVEVAFTKAMLLGENEPHRVARKISERYPLLRVTVAYERGNPSISATPVMPISAFSELRGVREDWDRFERQARAAALWPSFAEVHAYAAGCSAAARAEIEADKLRKENEKLKDELRHTRDNGEMVPYRPYLRRMW